MMPRYSEEDTNAKEEFLEDTEGTIVVCANISILKPGKRSVYVLPKNFSVEQYKKFLSDIDFYYDSGYGTAVLGGLILCKEGVWFDRDEYDGSESWQSHQYPTMEEFEALGVEE